MEYVAEYVAEYVTEYVTDRDCHEDSSQTEGVTEVWLFEKDSFKECPLTDNNKQAYQSECVMRLYLGLNGVKTLGGGKIKWMSE